MPGPPPRWKTYCRWKICCHYLSQLWCAYNNSWCNRRLVRYAAYLSATTGFGLGSPIKTVPKRPSSWEISRSLGNQIQGGWYPPAGTGSSATLWRISWQWSNPVCCVAKIFSSREGKNFFQYSSWPSGLCELWAACLKSSGRQDWQVRRCSWKDCLSRKLSGAQAGFESTALPGVLRGGLSCQKQLCEWTPVQSLWIGYIV